MGKTFTRAQLAYLISQGHVLVLHQEKVYKLNSWLANHPGGALPILHFVGRDAWCEIEAYHGEGTLGKMSSFIVGTVANSDSKKPWKPLVPPVQLGWPIKPKAYANVASINKTLANMPSKYDTDKNLQESASSALESPLYPLPPQGLEPPQPPKGLDPQQEHERALAWKDLHVQMRKAGLFDPTPIYNYRYEFVRYILLASLFVVVFNMCSSTWHYMVSAVILGILKHQLTFVVHDAGHSELTGVQWKDHLIGTLVADFMGGLSLGWWCDNHDVHHLVTNHTDHDPDIQHLPFFAISPKFFENRYSTYYETVLKWDVFASIFVPFQHQLYYIVMFLARFNLFALSYNFLLTKARNDRWKLLEAVGITFFWSWFIGLVLRHVPGLWAKLGFLILCFGAASPVHVQIVLSHFAQDTTDWGLYESFPRRQLRTTMDVSCHPYLDFLHGGLNFQVTHHLFPRLPRHNLRAATAFTQQYCQEQDLPYETWEFTDGNKKVLNVLHDVSRQIKVIGTVAKAQAEGKLHH